jgi:peptide-methionine (S)-S-oxide reductase
MINQEIEKGMALATFGNGCFWCTEAIFQQLKGVSKVVSGYAGGKVKNPTYKEVCTGLTGHAEVIQLTYEPAGYILPGVTGGFLANTRSHHP